MALDGALDFAVVETVRLQGPLRFGNSVSRVGAIHAARVPAHLAILVQAQLFFAHGP